MSPAAARQSIAFWGPVTCQQVAGTVRLRLCDEMARGPEAVEVLFSAVAAVEGPHQLPALLHAVRVLAMPAARGFCIEAQEGRFALQARSMQVHRPCAAAFYASLPREPLPWLMRISWALLPVALRVPGAARLLAVRR